MWHVPEPRRYALAARNPQGMLVYISGSQKSRLGQVLLEIGTLYFALPQPRGQPANPFGDMISSLFGGGGSGTSGPRVLTPGNATSHGLD